MSVLYFKKNFKTSFKKVWKIRLVGGIKRCFVHNFGGRLFNHLFGEERFNVDTVIMSLEVVREYPGGGNVWGL